MSQPQATQERWDVVVRLLNGPLAQMGEQILRGPVVRIGANPGPGGVQLNGYRGLDARQCVITAYNGGTASVAPVGTNQVRLAPHPNVNWKEIDPIRGPEYLSEGCAVHLGPVGRGATVQFVECRRLGVWQKGRLASEVQDLPAGSAIPGLNQGAGQRPIGGLAPGGIPAAYDARRVGRISGSNAPWWFLGCSTLMAGVTAASMLVIAVFVIATRNVQELGPHEQGLEFYHSVDPAEVSHIRPELLKGLETPFYDFVIAPDIAATDGRVSGLDVPKNWDRHLLEYTTAAVEKHVASRSFFGRLDAVRVEYARVVTAMREAGLPEVLAAIPYQESRYQRDMQSPVCARGYWQFMPEVAYRVAMDGHLPFVVKDCRFRGRSDFLWSPHDKAPPGNILENGEYMADGSCVIDRCDVDDRTDIEKSTAAAIYTLGEAFKDPTIAGSGAAVQITIASHNAGYNDARFGHPKSSNLLPAYQKWVKQVGAVRATSFVGDNIKCPDWQTPGNCGAVLPAETQHYVYPIIAQHLLAVCYYATNYGDEPAFKPWREYVTESDSYCKQFKIPSRTDAASWRQGG
jgi:hypothetical protein